MDKIDFKDKVKNMSAKEIIMAMVNGLKKAHVTVNMDSFGISRDNICYGCAATNTVCEIYGGSIPISHIDDVQNVANYVNAPLAFVECFEWAIDSLRKGYLLDYNSLAHRIGIAPIFNPNNIDLPKLTTFNYKTHLEPYIRLAEDNS